MLLIFIGASLGVVSGFVVGYFMCSEKSESASIEFEAWLESEIARKRELMSESYKNGTTNKSISWCNQHLALRSCHRAYRRLFGR